MYLYLFSKEPNRSAKPYEERERERETDYHRDCHSIHEFAKLLNFSLVPSRSVLNKTRYNATHKKRHNTKNTKARDPRWPRSARHTYINVLYSIYYILYFYIPAAPFSLSLSLVRLSSVIKRQTLETPPPT